MNQSFEKTNEGVNVHIRWMIRRDTPEVLEIEKSSFEFPWSEEDFIRCLRRRDCIGMVAEYDDRVVGFMFYELHKNQLHVLNFAVRPDFRRREVGTQMVEKLKGKLSRQRRNKITLEISEANLPGQMFFSQQGFRAVLILKDFYKQGCADAFAMRYDYESTSKPVFTNWITRANNA